jgi:hypothetical protein
MSVHEEESADGMRIAPPQNAKWYAVLDKDTIYAGQRSQPRRNIAKLRINSRLDRQAGQSWAVLMS